MSDLATPNRSLAQCLQDLRDFRASRPAHDLSVFRYRNPTTIEKVPAEPDQPTQPKRSKQRGLNVESE